MGSKGRLTLSSSKNVMYCLSCEKVANIFNKESSGTLVVPSGGDDQSSNL